MTIGTAKSPFMSLKFQIQEDSLQKDEVTSTDDDSDFNSCSVVQICLFRNTAGVLWLLLSLQNRKCLPFFKFFIFFFMIILCDCSQDRGIDGIPYWRLDFSCLCSLVSFSLAVSLLMEVTCGQLMLASFENCLLRTSQHKQLKSRFLEPFSTTIHITGILLAHICLSLGVLWLAYLN